MILCGSGFFVRLFSVCMSLVMDSWLSWRNELRGSRVNINGVTFPFFRGETSWSPSERKQWPIKQVLSTFSVEEDWLNGYLAWLYRMSSQDSFSSGFLSLVLAMLTQRLQTIDLSTAWRLLLALESHQIACSGSFLPFPCPKGWIDFASPQLVHRNFDPNL